MGLASLTVGGLRRLAESFYRDRRRQEINAQDAEAQRFNHGGNNAVASYEQFTASGGRKYSKPDTLQAVGIVAGTAAIGALFGIGGESGAMIERAALGAVLGIVANYGIIVVQDRRGLGDYAEYLRKEKEKAAAPAQERRIEQAPAPLAPQLDLPRKAVAVGVVR